MTRPSPGLFCAFLLIGGFCLFLGAYVAMVFQDHLSRQWVAEVNEAKDEAWLLGRKLEACRAADWNRAKLKRARE